MQSQSLAFQHLARLPSVALQQMSVMGQGLKNRMADSWQSASSSLEGTNLWRYSLKPLHDRYIKPLEKLDFYLLSGSLVAAILITFVITPVLFGGAAIPLGGAIGATIAGTAFYLVNRRFEHYFNQEAWQKVKDLREEVDNITHADRSYEKVTKAREALRKDEFSHLSTDFEELDRQLTRLGNTVLSDAIGKTEKNLTETKKTANTYLESLLKKLDPYKSIPNLQDRLIRAGGQL